MKYKAIIAYDGTDYAGWQIQPNVMTIASALQKSFFSTFKKEIKVIGASRTDAGVHALGQVISFNVDLDIDAQRLRTIWNNDLPGTILIRSLEHISQDFHPQKNVLQKTYKYHFFLEKPLPMIARYGFYFPHKIDEKKLRHALEVFQGTHDFRSFCTGYEQENMIRTIDEISLYYIKKFNVYRIEIKGKRFLHHMIRRIVGASLMVASKSVLSSEYLKEVLEQKDPEQELLNAPAPGLILYKIQYQQ